MQPRGDGWEGMGGRQCPLRLRTESLGLVKGRRGTLALPCEGRLRAWRCSPGPAAASDGWCSLPWKPC